MICGSVAEAALSLLKKSFGEEEVAVLLETIDEGGIDHGTLGQAVHAIIGIVKDRYRILERRVFDPTLAEDARYWALVLLVYHIQLTSMGRCIQLIDRYMERFPEDGNEEVIALLRHSMQERQEIYLY